MKTLNNIIIICIILLFFSCSTNEIMLSTKKYDFEKVWNKTIKYLERNNFTVFSKNHSDGYGNIGAQKFLPKNEKTELFKCGNKVNYDTAFVYLGMHYQNNFRKQISVYLQFGMGPLCPCCDDEWVCNSTGKFEDMIFDFIKEED